jgi:hypothetical protein
MPKRPASPPLCSASFFSYFTSEPKALLHGVKLKHPRHASHQFDALLNGNFVQ